MRLLCFKTANCMTNGSFWTVKNVSEEAITVVPLEGGEPRTVLTTWQAVSKTSVDRFMVLVSSVRR